MSTDRGSVRVAVAVAALAALVAAVIVVAALSGDDPAPDAADGAPISGTSQPAGSSPPPSTVGGQPTASAPGSTGVPGSGDPDGPAPSLPPAPLDEPVDYGDGVSAAIVEVTPFQAQGQGVGETSGPALLVTIVLSNGTPQEISLDTVTVNLASGEDLLPAPPLADPSARPFAGVVAGGASAQGAYAFSVPEEVRDSITITVNYTAGSVTAVFTGPVG